jgi:hypothetical protein
MSSPRFEPGGPSWLKESVLPTELSTTDYRRHNFTILKITVINLNTLA